MATLELAIDARPMVQGAQQAQQALDGVAKTAQATAKEVEKTGKAAADAGKSVSQSGAAMRAAFQATGGSIQVAGGIAQTAKAFAELNVAAAAFGSSRALLEIGKTVQDFKELGATVGKTSSIFTTLGMIVKANPLLTIATVLGSVGSLMSIFADNTQKAAGAFEDLGEAMSKARMDAATAAYLAFRVQAVRGSNRRSLRQSAEPGRRVKVSTCRLSALGLAKSATARRRLVTLPHKARRNSRPPRANICGREATASQRTHMAKWVRVRR